MSKESASGPSSSNADDKPAPQVLPEVDRAAGKPEQDSGSGEAKAEGNPDVIANANPDAVANPEVKPETKPDDKAEEKSAAVIAVKAKTSATPENKSLEEEELELSKQEKKERLAERKKELAQREKEANDRRSQLIKAVRFSAPAIDKALVDKFEALSIDSHAFSAKDVVKLMTNDAKLPEKVLDFFDLNLAQREDLLDRIGYYKGIVIDHCAANPV